MWRNRREVLPSDLLRMWHDGLKPKDAVSVDTETSGLFVDDGARMSTVSVSWIDDDGTWAGVLDTHSWGGGIQEYREWVIDDELRLPLVALAWPFDQGVSGTGKAEDAGYLTMWPDADNQPEGEWRALLEWLALVGADVGLTMHHAKFDLHICEAGCRRWPGIGVDLADYVTWDTQNVCALLYPKHIVWVPRIKGYQQTTSLKPTSEILWGEGETDEQKVIQAYLRKHKLPPGRWDLMPWDVVSKYAMDDASKTARLKRRQLRDMELRGFGSWLTGENKKLSKEEATGRRLATSLMLRRIERRGLPFAVDSAQNYSTLLQQRQKELTHLLPFSPPTLPAAKKFWFGKREDGGMGLSPYATTGTGEPSVTEDVIDRMVVLEVQGASEWRNIQKAQTADSRWYQGWAQMVGSDGRLRCSIRQNGTVSSRFSVERIQLQAIPHNYKLSGFSALEGIPTPRALITEGVPNGYKLWELDLSQAELRVAALFAGCRRMLEAIANGDDLHGLATQELFNVFPGDDAWDEYRNIAKRANFSLIFGIGPDALQANIAKYTGIVLPLEQVQKIVKDWNALYPEFKRAIYRTKDRVEARMADNEGYGWVDLINGERRWFLPGEETHKAFNQRVQPNLAQFGIDWWLWSENYLMDQYSDDIYYNADDWVGRVGMVLTIHDSQLLLLPDTPEGAAHVDVIKAKGRELWSEWFVGVPGDIDAKEWGK